MQTVGNTRWDCAGIARRLAVLSLLLASCAHALEFDYMPGRPEGVARGMTLSGEPVLNLKRGIFSGNQFDQCWLIDRPSHRCRRGHQEPRQRTLGDCRATQNG